MSSTPTQTVTLRDGEELDANAVNVFTIILTQLKDEDYLTFSELVMKCRDRNHRPILDCEPRLKSKNLLMENGQPHDMLRSFVLNAVTGHIASLELHSPIRTEGEADATD